MTDEQDESESTDSTDSSESTDSPSETSGSEDDTSKSSSSGGSGGSQESGEPGDLGISDDDLPEDVRPSEDNPLARHPDQTGDDDDEIGPETEGDPETAPLSADDADYGEGGAAG